MQDSRRTALLQEFDSVIAPQKTALSEALPSLFSRYYAPPPGLPVQPGARVAAVGTAGGGAGAGGVAKSSKRPSGGGAAGEQPSSKRARGGPPGPPMDEDERQVQTMFKQCRELITRKIWGKKECSAFKEPVDPIKLNIPDYHRYVTHPMDVGTVRKKLEQTLLGLSPGYKTPLEVRDDMRLVWKNCSTYNPPGHAVRKSGDVLSNAWEAAWAESRMEERWNEFALQRDPKVGVCSVCVCGSSLLSSGYVGTRKALHKQGWMHACGAHTRIQTPHAPNSKHCSKHGTHHAHGWTQVSKACMEA